MSQLLRVSLFLFKVESISASHYVPPCASICMTREEDLRKWDGEHTWRLEAQVQELQKKSAARRHPSRKITAPFSAGQSRRANYTFDPDEETSHLQSQKSSNEDSDQEKKGPAFGQAEKKDNQVYWTMWVQRHGTSDPEEYKDLVDTGARCTLTPSVYKGSESICTSGVTGYQELSLLEAEVNLTESVQKHPTGTGLEGPCILGIDNLRRAYFKHPKGY